MPYVQTVIRGRRWSPLGSGRGKHLRPLANIKNNPWPKHSVRNRGSNAVREATLSKNTYVMDEGCMQVRQSRDAKFPGQSTVTRQFCIFPLEIFVFIDPISWAISSNPSIWITPNELEVVGSWGAQITSTIRFWLYPEQVFPLPRHTTSRSGPAIPEKADEISRHQVREAPCETSTPASRRQPFG